MDLVALLRRIPVRAGHWVQRRLGIFDGMHSWLHGFCPCQVEADLPEECYGDLAATA